MRTYSALGMTDGEIPQGRCYGEGKKLALVMFTVENEICVYMCVCDFCSPGQSDILLTAAQGTVRKAGALAVKNFLVHKKNKKVESATRRKWKHYWVSLKGERDREHPSCRAG